MIRDISWLWRTAYNCAIDGCSNWEHQGEQVSEAFDSAREVGILHGLVVYVYVLIALKQLLEIYISRTLTEVEPNAYLYIANAYFAATSGRGTYSILFSYFFFAHQTPSDLGT